MSGVGLFLGSIPHGCVLGNNSRIAERDVYDNRRLFMTLHERVEGTLQNVRPSLQADGGDVQLVEVNENGVVKVRLTGACHGCPMSQMTLKMGIEKFLKENVPEVTAVESV